jgi:hypothetical protein
MHLYFHQYPNVKKEHKQPSQKKTHRRALLHRFVMAQKQIGELALLVFLGDQGKNGART